MTRHKALTVSTEVFDCDSAPVVRFVEGSGAYRTSNQSQAVERLHDAVRDTIDYNVFNVPLNERLAASTVVEEGVGFCLHKSILFVAGCRRLGVPATLCSDIVTNHVADAAMIELVGGEEFLHWYARIYLNGRWIKAAPIFNSLLCALYGVDVLRFRMNGDSIAQRNSDSTTMLYQGYQRIYTDPQMSDLVEIIRDKHPKMIDASGRTPTSLQLTQMVAL